MQNLWCTGSTAVHWSLGKISQAGCAGNSKAWYFYRQVGIGWPIRLNYSSCSHLPNKTIIQAKERHGTTQWSISLSNCTLEERRTRWSTLVSCPTRSTIILATPTLLATCSGSAIVLVAMLFNAMVYSTCSHLHRKCDCTQCLSGRRPTHFSGHPLSVGCTSALWR